MNKEEWGCDMAYLGDKFTYKVPLTLQVGFIGSGFGMGFRLGFGI